MSYPLGFSTGCLWKLMQQYEERIRFYSGISTDALEINLPTVDMLSWYPSSALLRVIQTFKYVSIHAPKQLYEVGNVTEQVAELKELAKLLKAKAIVLHPNETTNLKLVESSLGSLAAFENMDVRQKGYNNVDQMAKVFEICPSAKLVLDLGHAHTVDPTMQLSADFLEHFGARLAHFHLSFVTQAQGNHHLILSKPDSNIMSFKFPTNIPIIIESVSTTTKEDIKKEYDYIKALLDAKI